VSPTRRTSLILAALLLAQMVAGALTNFKLEAPLFGEPGFLLNAAPHATQIAGSAILGLLNGVAGVVVAVLLYPILSTATQGVARTLLVFAAANLAVAVAEQSSVMSMLSLSQAFAKTPGAQPADFAIAVGVVSSARNWTHFIARLADGLQLFTLYAALFRYRLAPRPIALLGVLATSLLFYSISGPFFGRAVNFDLLAPMGVSQLAFVIWLAVKGFKPATANA
jgi:hypothetical protein